MIKLVLSVTACALLVISGIVLHGLSAFELPERAQQTLSFSLGDAHLEGTLLLPDNQHNPPVVLLVHGDGAQDRWSDGGYLPLVNALVAQGIGVFSWDKPGVAASSGDWLAQTLRDRAEEAVAAVQALRARPELKESRLGFLGFSQAGWVVPYASQHSTADFIVLIGPAINWREQGFYYMQQRLAAEGAEPPVIAAAIATERAAYAQRFSPQTVMQPCASRCTRDDFERRNALSDARQDIAAQRVPVMVLMGAQDLNVSSKETLTVWSRLLPVATSRCLREVKDATHGLLRAKWFNYQLSEQWPRWTQWGFLAAGQSAYAPGALNAISEWVLERRC
ncbi:alpha/beta hydrolase [Candidatus Symbiopectobacterium sp. NZEC127]|uniref:alpha/beta hydrolase family protein n=1 Tax=Candidatus Symbiopectobacterium sp. NZEC127 TaxID=2820472 RepID=UPI0022277832|nr:alpha/beta fold hydrolase [Candidatus Symbiopectobacterium sp. NZEC127]MCW2485070.1 alpha/beta hydrolase [Candidatus Symbiopectobacterium sp. NZEC127]